MDEIKICNNCDNEKLGIKFYFRKAFQKYTNECKQYLNNKRRKCKIRALKL